MPLMLSRHYLNRENPHESIHFARGATSLTNSSFTGVTRRSKVSACSKHFHRRIEGDGEGFGMKRAVGGLGLDV